MKISFNFPESVMYNLFVNALSAGITELSIPKSEWDKIYKYLDGNPQAFDLLEDNFGKSNAYEPKILAYLKADPTHTVVFFDEYEEEPCPVTWESMLEGVQLMANKEERHFSDAIEKNDDAITGDVWLQLTLFGEVKYC